MSQDSIFSQGVHIKMFNSVARFVLFNSNMPFYIQNNDKTPVWYKHI